MKPLHGFFQDEKWYEDLGHILLGVLPIGLLLWAREWTDWPLPWPLRGQWPPGDVINIERGRAGDNSRRAYRPADQISSDGATWGDPYTPLDRVSDVGRDELGYRIGATLRNAGLIVWWVV